MRLLEKYSHQQPGVVVFGKIGETVLRVRVSGNKDAAEITEPRHYHKESIQYFLSTKGSVTVEVDGTEITVTPDNLLEISPGEVYRVMRNSDDSQWVIIGSKNIDGDRVEL